MAFTYMNPGFKSLSKEQGRFRIYNRQLLKGSVERGKQRDKVLSQPEGNNAGRCLNLVFLQDENLAQVGTEVVSVEAFTAPN